MPRWRRLVVVAGKPLRRQTKSFRNMIWHTLHPLALLQTLVCVPWNKCHIPKYVLGLRKSVKRILLEHGVLSDSMPVCFSCLEPMKKIDRSANGTVACQTSGGYIHPKITWPREAYSPLHGQARQNLGLFSHIFFMFYIVLPYVKNSQGSDIWSKSTMENSWNYISAQSCRNVDVDYMNFLRVCYLVGTKMPTDMMPHYVTDVGRNRVLAWAADIRLACATAEFIDSQDISFEPGVLEFDTAAAAISRKPTQKDLSLVCVLVLFSTQ